VKPLVDEVVRCASQKAEILQTDDAIFSVWPAFVVAGEKLLAFRPRVQPNQSPAYEWLQEEGLRLISQGFAIISDIVRARTPMPKTTREYIEKLDRYAERIKCEAASKPAASV
jgi:hypothetical protein